MKFGDLLNKLSKKSGIDAANKALVDLLSKAELSNTEIPDELANAIDTALMNVEAAKAHPEVIKKVKGEALNGADAVVSKLIEELGFATEDAADIVADKNTFSKIEKMIKKTAELTEKKNKSTDGADKKALQKQIDDLHQAQKDLIKKNQETLTAKEAEFNGLIIDKELQTLVAQKKLSLPEEMPVATKNSIVMAAIKSELAAKGFQIVNTNGTMEVKKSDGTDAFDDQHNKIVVTNLIDGVLAQNKLLQVNERANPANPTVVIPGSDKNIINPKAVANADQALKDAGLIPS